MAFIDDITSQARFFAIICIIAIMVRIELVFLYPIQF